MQIVIEIDEKAYEQIKRIELGAGLWPTTLALYNSVQNGKPLPKDATNGDIIKAMFPSMETFRTSDVVEIRYKVHDEVWCVSALDNVWWDEPYKADKEG